LPVLDWADAEEVLSGLDGLLLAGGGDVAASCYGEDPAPEAYGVDAARDGWELALVAAARAAGLPILGVCRGAQVLNVAAGGTLIQHLPVLTDESHKEYERDRETVHPVEVDPASLLAAITGQRTFGVNTLHHQAVAEVGPSLRPVAWAPDGVIEAVESVDDRLLLGVQWHPELLTHQPPHDRLFAWLAQAAADRQGATVLKPAGDAVPRDKEVA
jgi:putative glutamine amidotransferase